MGTDAFLNDWETYAAGEKTRLVPVAGCATRTGRPAVALCAPAVWPLLRSARPSSPQVTSEEAVCGQCHNYIGRGVHPCAVA